MTWTSLIPDFSLQTNCSDDVNNADEPDDAMLFTLQSPAAATSTNSSSAVKVTSGELTLTCIAAKLAENYPFVLTFFSIPFISPSAVFPLLSPPLSTP